MFILQIACVEGRGGISTAVAHYERMFRAVGVRSSVLFRGPAIDRLREEGFDVIEAPGVLTSPLAGILPVLGGVRQQVLQRARGEPIVMIVHSDRSLPALRRLFPGAHVVTPCHSDKFKHKTGADLVITLNVAQQGAAREALPGSRVVMLGNPYVAPRADPASIEGAPRFNFVARFIPAKDPMTMMRAAGLLNRPDIEFRFTGAGDMDNELKAAARDLGVNAIFPGWATAPFETFHRNDVLVLPSKWEGLPYLLQEALDHEAPIIASDNAGNRAALNDGAFGAIFPVGDADALASAMSSALSNLDGLRARSRLGREALHARYSAAGFWALLRKELDSINA